MSLRALQLRESIGLKKKGIIKKMQDPWYHAKMKKTQYSSSLNKQGHRELTTKKTHYML